MQQIFLRDLRAKTGKRAKDLQPTSDQHKQRYRVHPVAQAHRQRMLVNRPRGFMTFLTLRAIDLDYRTAHLLTSRGKLQPVKPRISLVFPIAHAVEYARDFQFGQILGLLVSDLGRYG